MLPAGARTPLAMLQCVEGASAAGGNAQAHPFFAGVRWGSLTNEPAPHVPVVTHELDTQNFESYKEGEGEEGTLSSGGGGRGRWARADPNFIGYTYKAWEAISPQARARPPLAGSREGYNGFFVARKPHCARCLHARVCSYGPGEAAYGMWQVQRVTDVVCTVGSAEALNLACLFVKVATCCSET